MIYATQLFGFLILTVLGILAPLITLLLSVYREGSQQLRAKYETEVASAEESLEKQTKRTKGSTLNIKEIEKKTKELKKTEKKAKNKLSLLDAKKQSSLLFIPPIFSFIILLASYFVDSFIKPWMVLISVSFFVWAVFNIWKLIKVIIEVKEPIDLKRKGDTQRSLDLLSQLVKNSTEYFLENVYVKFIEKDIKDDETKYTLKLNEKKECRISFENDEKRMAKNVEVGLGFPKGFDIEKSGSYRIYSSEEGDVVRWNISQAQGLTTYYLTSLIITPLTPGKFTINTFIKAENIASVNKDIEIEVG